MPNLNALSHIINASISANAKILWMMMFMNVDEQKNVWVKQATLAEQLHCSKSTVGRMLRVLREAGLIVDTGKRHAGKFKIYEFPSLQTSLDISSSSRAKRGDPEISTGLPRRYAPRNDESNKNDIADELLAQHGVSWRRRFVLLDGKDGRHTLEAGVREASKYKFWHKHSPTMYGWVEEWLGQAMIHYSRKPKPKQQNLPV